MAVAEFITNFTSGMVSSYGINAEALLVIVALFFSLGVAAYASSKMKNSDAGVFVFFAMFLLFAIFEVISFVVFAMPLVVIGALYFFRVGDR